MRSQKERRRSQGGHEELRVGGEARRSQEKPGAARRSQEQPGRARRRTGGARRQAASRKFVSSNRQILIRYWRVYWRVQSFILFCI